MSSPLKLKTGIDELFSVKMGTAWANILSAERDKNLFCKTDFVSIFPESEYAQQSFRNSAYGAPPKFRKNFAADAPMMPEIMSAQMNGSFFFPTTKACI